MNTPERQYRLPSYIRKIHHSPIRRRAIRLRWNHTRSNYYIHIRNKTTIWNIFCELQLDCRWRHILEHSLHIKTSYRNQSRILLRLGRLRLKLNYMQIQHRGTRLDFGSYFYIPNGPNRMDKPELIRNHCRSPQLLHESIRIRRAYSITESSDSSGRQSPLPYQVKEDKGNQLRSRSRPGRNQPDIRRPNHRNQQLYGLTGR